MSTTPLTETVRSSKPTCVSTRRGAIPVIFLVPSTLLCLCIHGTELPNIFLSSQKSVIGQLPPLPPNNLIWTTSPVKLSGVFTPFYLWAIPSHDNYHSDNFPQWKILNCLGRELSKEKLSGEFSGDEFSWEVVKRYCPGGNCGTARGKSEGEIFLELSEKGVRKNTVLILAFLFLAQRSSYRV